MLYLNLDRTLIQRILSYPAIYRLIASRASGNISFAFEIHANVISTARRKRRKKVQSAPPQRAVKCMPSGTNACHRKMRSILLNENEKKRKRAAAAALCGKGDKERRVRGRITDAKLFAVHKSSITRDFPFGKVHKRFFSKDARGTLRDKNEVMFPGAIQPRPVLVRSNE